MKEYFVRIPEVIIAIQNDIKLPAGWRYMYESPESQEPCNVIAGSKTGGSMMAIDLPLEKDHSGCYKIYYRP